MSEIEEAVASVRQRIVAACQRAGREPGTVTLIGATKQVPVTIVAEARAAGVEHFGENHAKDLEAKAQAVQATWHFLGKLQTGTARKVADHADVVHSAEPGGGLDALARRAKAAGRSVPCLAQVDFTGRRQGVAPEALERLLTAAGETDGLRMVGLMTVPPLTAQHEGARPYFRRLRDLLEGLSGRWPDLRELSMGMSADLEIAVEEGATMVRVGTALFGERRRAGADPGSGEPRPG
jgi:pyridoxal phosphate enzyme (YggS family)